MKEGDLEIQGNHLDGVRQLLGIIRYRVKGNARNREINRTPANIALC